MSAQSLVFKQCTNGCCHITIKPYTHIHTSYDFRHKFKNFKAGVFFCDPTTNKVLLVQSRGMKWGPPKGSIDNDDETIEECAIREVFEETGIIITKNDLVDVNRTRIDRATYFYIERSAPTDAIHVPGGHDNDASGITWINVDCLYKMIELGEVDLNSHGKKLVKKYSK